MNNKYVVVVENLNKTYGKRHILKDVSFKISHNEIVGFIGPNGAGKSTTMKCLCNLVIPDSGKIQICDVDLFKEKEKALSYQASLIETPGLYLDMTGRKNIHLISKMRDITKERVKEIEDFIGLRDKLDIKVSQYSMGMKQRLGLGIALLSKPKFLILDEPTNGLDPNGIIDLRNTLQQLIKDEDISILFSSHQLGEVEKLADRIICINNGKIIETPEVISERFSYILQLSDLEKARPIIESIIDKEKIQYISLDNVKVSLENQKLLSELLSELLEKGILILDINKAEIDIESVYQQVYGDKND
ncbi:ATP-binding cassette domain-containing protein [Tissierella pigra]|uniref:ATP-binding cassette domain-containing protein n=1 Tax=Tissierella pigra TaxID=2607614 RepID=A0A6N7XHR4_9FIRM|nr:ATP-binding cassette domain-containing protein [Tissierella pigra]MBU5425831.1 ATP-binding cassette domain-containing protein [Tissierella pigra]MSU01591.1 ATP-binding cassette domain-containing protein [Tissierella pigra]